jgi:type IV pilus assembly protein PilX
MNAPRTFRSSSSRGPKPLAYERGTALVVALLFLVILSMIGIASMTGTTLEEKMSGNARDRNIALQAAEAALRDAENDLTQAGSRVTGTSSFVTACTNGLCLTSCPGTPAACPVAPVSNLDTVTTAVNAGVSSYYGQRTGGGTISGPNHAPTYIIELLQGADANLTPGTPTPPTGTSNHLFRITAMAWGQSTSTIVTLQEIYRMPF